MVASINFMLIIKQCKSLRILKLESDVYFLCWIYIWKNSLPPEAKKNDIFYCRPLQYFKDKAFWYSAQPRGKYFLNNMVKSMFQETNIPGNFTNHSLQATGATELFRQEVPKKIIKEHTGHRSVGSLRQYEKVGLEQKQATCNILTGSSNDGLLMFGFHRNVSFSNKVIGF